MIQVILQGIIQSKIEFNQYEDLSTRASSSFKLKCLNTLQKNVLLDCYAYNSMAVHIYSEYQKEDVVTCLATLDFRDNKIQCLIFSIEPSNITMLPHRRTLINDYYVDANKEYTTEDIKAYLKIK